MKLSKYKTHQTLHCIPQILYQEEEKKLNIDKILSINLNKKNKKIYKQN